MIGRRQVFGLSASALLAVQASGVNACSLVATTPQRERRRRPKRLSIVRNFLKSIAEKNAEGISAAISTGPLELNGRHIDPIYNDADFQKVVSSLLSEISFDEVKEIVAVGDIVIAALEENYHTDESSECGDIGIQKLYIRFNFSNADQIYSVNFV